MLTVRQIAGKYGVTTTFLTLALEKIGFHAATPDALLSAATVARFETEFGAKIRAARPVSTPAPAFTAGSDSVPPRVRGGRERPPHLMRIAHAKVTAKRVPAGFVDKFLLDDPGPVHALDAAGTWDGDPWRGQPAPGDVHFFDGPANSGPFAACGYAKIRAVLGDEFVPADDPKAAGQCPKCARAVREGHGFRTPPHERRSYFCEEYLRFRTPEGRTVVESCYLRDLHDGPHRSPKGGRWERGAEDYKPAHSAADPDADAQPQTSQ